MIVRFGQIMTAQEVRRAEVTRLVAGLLREGVDLDVLMQDAADGVALSELPEPSQLRPAERAEAAAEVLTVAAAS